MVELSVIVPTLKDPSEVACTPFFEQSSFDDYELLVQQEKGAARARNEGIRRAKADKLVFLDDDSYPMEGYLPHVDMLLDDHHAVAGRIVHPYNDIYAKFTNFYDHGDSAQHIDHLVGCNMALRREVFDTVGMFDEDFVWGHEESELARRVCKGYDIFYDPDLRVRHSYAESVFDLWRKHYALETHRSLYWDKIGMSKPEQLLRFAWWAFNPRFYWGESITHSAVKAGKHMAENVGRIRGLLANDFAAD